MKIQQLNINYSIFKNIIIVLILLTISGCTNNRQWNLEQIHVYDAWQISKGSTQTIAFIDSGIAPTLLEKYKGRIVSPYNARTGTFDVTGINGHGTEMVTAACGSGVDGIWGVAPSARIMPILAADDNGFASPEAITKGIEWATSHNATVINLSIGNVKPNQLITNAIQLALEKHIIVVAAAGDYGDTGLLFPASMPGVISVGAQDRNGNLLPSSNHSPDISIVALGSDISVISIDTNNKTFLKK